MEEEKKTMDQSEEDIPVKKNTEETCFNFSDLENELESNLAAHLSDIQLLEEQKAAIGNPESLGKTIMNVVWVQFINQIGTVAGEDFVRENRNLPLDLSRDAHIQTAENFRDGKIADHNTHTDYQKRYDEWQDKFEHDNQGNVVTHTDRTQKVVPNVKKDARVSYDIDRPHGSKEDNLAMDHTVPIVEIVRDPAMAAFMEEADRIAFANSPANLRELRADWNQSKSALSMRDWLETPNANGQTPEQIFNISPEQKAELLRRDKEARDYMERVKKDFEAKAVSEGKQSQIGEAVRIGGKAIRAVLMGLLAQLVRKIISKLIAWFKEKNRNLESLINQIKAAIIDFFIDVKSNLMVSADTAITTIVVSAVSDTLRKVWVMLKQGTRSVIEAIYYLKNPENRKKSIGILVLEVGKIIVAGLTGAGAFFLGEVITKALSSVPVFAVTIPLIGSLASIIGMFLSSVIMGIVGALVLNLIDMLIAKTQKQEITKLQIDKNNDIIATQEKIITVRQVSSVAAREMLLEDIEKRHAEATALINDALDSIFGPMDLPEST